MRKILLTIDNYIPEFFIFTPIIIWVAAYLSKLSVLETAFLRCWWWMFLGVALAEFDVIYSKAKNFL